MPGYEEKSVLLGSLRTRNPIIREMLSEFLGTLILVLMCDCSIAVQVLDGHQGVNLVAVGLATGVALMLAAYLGAKVSGGHVNPVVTLSLATLGKFPWRKVPHYFLAQYLGGFVATALAYANHYNAITIFDGGARSAFFQPNSTAGLFTSHPQSEEHLTIAGALLDQILATGLLQFGIMCIIDEKNLNVPKPLIPIALFLLLAGLVIAFGLNAGPALNPARDLIARVFAAMAGYGSEVFSPLGHTYWFFGGLLGPHLGGIIGAWVYYLFIELHLDDGQEKSKDKKEEILLTKTAEA